MAAVVSVFKRYIMNMPTAWIFDLDNMLYGTTFMLCGAYTLAQNAHVRGDFLYSSMRPRMQACSISCCMRCFSSLNAASYTRFRLCLTLADRGAFERDGGRPAGLLFQVGHSARRRAGDAAGHRRDRALRRLPADREWPSRLKDVAEIDVIEQQLAHSEYVDESRKIAIERAHEIDEAGASAAWAGLEHMSDPALGP
jgi:hypothetical protein